MTSTAFLLDTEVQRVQCEYCDTVLLWNGWDGEYYEEDGTPIKVYEGLYGHLRDDGIVCCSEDCFFEYLDISRLEYYRQINKAYGWGDDNYGDD